MGTFIQGIGAITIQETLQKCLMDRVPVSYNTPYVRCIDPPFRDHLDMLSARRMSRIVKRAIISAEKAITDSGITMPGAVISGTGLGCIEDTEKFLDAMIRDKESCLQPTSFIQSTHNTISSQLAIRLKCNGHNNTHVHNGVSFESALIESILLMRANRVSSVLVGGYDEMTPSYFKLLRNIGYWRDNVVSTIDIIDNPGNGSFAGEGSISLMISNARTDTSYCEIINTTLNYKPASPIKMINDFLFKNGTSFNEIDAFVTGMSGDIYNDNIYNEACKEMSNPGKIVWFKHLCGDFYTSPAFALFSMAECFRLNMIPSFFTKEKKTITNPEKILIYNNSRNNNHSLILLSKC